MSHTKSSAQANARPIRKIAFAFETSLPASRMISFNKFRRKLARAGVRLPVLSVPLETLPADVDLVIAPTDLVQRIQERVYTAEVIPLDNIIDETFLDNLVDRLRATQAVHNTARKGEKPIIVSYRGDERIG